MTNSKITLHDILEVCNRLEDKMDKRLCVAEEKIDALEAFQNNILGKLALATAFISLVFVVVIDWVRARLKI